MPRKKPELKRFRAVFSGRVQGVGFRYYAQREATRFKATGWVRNLAGGNVEVMAQGRPEHMTEFLKSLREGPPLAWVRNAVVDWMAPDDSLVTFEIRSTGW